MIKKSKNVLLILLCSIFIFGTAVSSVYALHPSEPVCKNPDGTETQCPTE